MDRKRVLFAATISLLLGGCFSNESANPIVSQQFVHKYGFDVTAQEWEARDGDGKIVETLKSGVQITRSYENGALQGPTTYTFPNSKVIEKLQVYDQGNLLKEVVQDGTGMPIREEIYEFDERTLVTVWDEKGAPLSIEELNGTLLVEGKYYTSSHELEGQVEVGYGERVKRERSGELVSRDKIRDGVVASRTTFHPNGEIHTISHLENGQLHGEQLKFTAAGKPLMKLSWNQGVLDGPKVVYRNGYKVAEIPYVKGQKNGTEIHYDDLGNLTAQVEWKSDKKHGLSQSFTDESTDTEWFYKGQVVAKDKYESMATRDRLVADLHGEIQ
jgi:antitoxin component YwqK of YwqJK toxin-antitoxin module